jgi:hypothetical protein
MNLPIFHLHFDTNRFYPVRRFEMMSGGEPGGSPETGSLTRITAHFGTLEEVNSEICNRNDKFCFLNSGFRSFFRKLDQIHARIGDAPPLENGGNDLLYYRKKMDIIMEYFAQPVCRSMLDEFTDENMNVIRKCFFQMIYTDPPILLCSIPPPVIFGIRKTKKVVEISHFLKFSPIDTALGPSLNKFWAKLVCLQGDLQGTCDALLATWESYAVSKRHPSCTVLANFDEFKKFLRIHRKLKDGLNQNIRLLATDFLTVISAQKSVESKLDDMLKAYDDFHITISHFRQILEDETSAKREVIELRIIGQARRDYEFYSPLEPNKRVQTWIETEPAVIDFLLDCQNSISAGNEYLDGLVEMTDKLKWFLGDECQKLRDKVKAKSATIHGFQSKHPRVNSAPAAELVRKRSVVDELSEQMESDIGKMGRNFRDFYDRMSFFKDAIDGFSGIWSFFEDGKDLSSCLFSSANLEWIDRLRMEFERRIERKRERLVELNKEKEKAEKVGERCCHPKTLCIVCCGHTFCEKCMREAIQAVGTVCPVCQTRFGKLDVVAITWEAELCMLKI